MSVNAISVGGSNCYIHVGKSKKEVVDIVRRYFGLVVEEEYDILSVMETTAYEMTAALSILNILLENGYDKSELSGKVASHNVHLYFKIFVFMYFLKIV